MLRGRLTSPGPTGFGTTLVDEESGSEINGISRISLSITPENLNVIEVEIQAVSVEADGIIEFYVADPASGGSKKVSRIEFEDGTAWDA